MTLPMQLFCNKVTGIYLLVILDEFVILKVK